MAWKEAKRKSFPTPRLSPSPRAGALAYSKRLNVSSELSCQGARRKSHDLLNVIHRNGRRAINNTRRKERKTMTTHKTGTCEEWLPLRRANFRARAGRPPRVGTNGSLKSPKSPSKKE